LRPTARALSTVSSAESSRCRGGQYESWFNTAERALAALENGQPAQPVEQIKETAVVGGDVVALDALRGPGGISSRANRRGCARSAILTIEVPAGARMWPMNAVVPATTIWPPPGQSKYPT